MRALPHDNGQHSGHQATRCRIRLRSTHPSTNVLTYGERIGDQIRHCNQKIFKPPKLSARFQPQEVDQADLAVLTFWPATESGPDSSIAPLES
jgi:hypothetical protein